jgi:hypothetical protein
VVLSRFRIPITNVKCLPRDTHTHTHFQAEPKYAKIIKYKKPLKFLPRPTAMAMAMAHGHGHEPWPWAMGHGPWAMGHGPWAMLMAMALGHGHGHGPRAMVPRSTNDFQGHPGGFPAPMGSLRARTCAPGLASSAAWPWPGQALAKPLFFFFVFFNAMFIFEHLRH